MVASCPNPTFLGPVCDSVGKISTHDMSEESFGMYVPWHRAGVKCKAPPLIALERSKTARLSTRARLLERVKMIFS